ncbi:synaptotagmin-like protein 2 [Rhinichthys klamathensis goyatoka]|uniref:synaptotagmin-like protein 2 n=1 Tax=Rhinichthys klamathensis goyatoka TaxID=3034132 RepID=UPI0024B5EE32|nr:synaptotagmin-like protein 2 [Rhinichthys klamathensis goyatoka]
MTDDGKLVHIKDAGLDVDSEHIDKSSVEPIQPAKSTSVDDPGLGQGSSELKDEEDSADILLSVLARAQRARPPVLQKITALEPKQEIRDDTLPTIVIIPSESPDPTELKGSKHGVSVLEALLEASTCKTPSYTADAWKDEGVDSDDDDDETSLSSYGSDLSSRKGYSASALSLTDRTSSLLSVYSDAGDFGNVEVQGSVEFAVMYSPVGELIIMIEQCQDLAFANPRKQRTDPYVKTYLYPDKSRRSKRKTSIKKRTVNPVYVESLRYKVKREELPEKTLNLSVWHNDSRGRNVFLGQVEISLKTWDWGHEALTWYNLQSTTAENQESQESNGFLSVSLKYVPQESTGGSKNCTGEIHVWLREAKELRGLKPQGVDSFVKCYILPDTRKKSRQKTRVVKKSQDPVYNHAMVYDGFKAGEVSEACCELTVWDHNKLSNQFLGGLRLSLGTGKSYGKKVDWMDSLNEEVQIWKRMLANPNCWVEGELPLRSSMTPRK